MNNEYLGINNYQSEQVDNMVNISCNLDMSDSLAVELCALCDKYNVTISDIMKRFICWATENPEEAAEWLKSKSKEYNIRN